MFTLKLFAKEIPFQHFPIIRSHQPSVVFHNRNHSFYLQCDPIDWFLREMQHCPTVGYEGSVKGQHILSETN